MVLNPCCKCNVLLSGLLASILTPRLSILSQRIIEKPILSHPCADGPVPLTSFTVRAQIFPDPYMTFTLFSPNDWTASHPTFLLTHASLTRVASQIEQSELLPQSFAAALSSWSAPPPVSIRFISLLPLGSAQTSPYQRGLPLYSYIQICSYSYVQMQLQRQIDRQIDSNSPDTPIPTLLFFHIASLISDIVYMYLLSLHESKTLLSTVLSPVPRLYLSYRGCSISIY